MTRTKTRTTIRTNETTSELSSIRSLDVQESSTADESIPGKTIDPAEKAELGTIMRRKTQIVSLIMLIGPVSSTSLPGEEILAFRLARAFDGETVRPEAIVIVRDGVMAAIGCTEVPAGAKIIECQGKTLTPGLIDAHTHTFSADQLKSAVVLGVTTELDMFTSAAFAAARRSEQAAGRAFGRADLFSAGTLVTAPEGHGTEYGFADLVLVDGDPTAEITATHKIAGVWKQGHAIDRAAYR